MSENQISKDVIYVASDEIARSYRWHDDFKRLSPEIQVVSIDIIPAMREGGLVFPEKIERDSILVRSPFHRKRFYDINNAEDYIIREKIGALSIIAQKIGASKIIGHVELLEEEELDKSANGQIEYKTVKLDADYKEEQQRRYNKRFELERIFPKAICTDDTYKEALALVKHFHFRDPEILDLVDMRQPGELNTIGSEKVHMAISEEINSAKDFAASLTVMGNLFKMGVKTNKTISTKKTFVFETLMEF